MLSAYWVIYCCDNEQDKQAKDWAWVDMHLDNFDTQRFLRESWQKKPQLIRNPWARWVNPLEPNELAGLACEEDIEARLIMYDPHMGPEIGAAIATARGADWKVERGPFPESRFGEIGSKRWTLLVQAVDHHVPDVAALVAPFRFVPNWRIDDVMVSVAADDSGVGAHFDHYDVFLIQGAGRRRWRVGAQCDASAALLPHDDLRLLAEFAATDEWVLEPGDILYVPPGFAHEGVAVGDDCMTYSIGFRAPSRSELMAHYCDHLLSEMSDDDRYGDPGLSRQDNPGEIGAGALTALHTMITEKMADRAAFARWFGQYNSTPKYSDMDWQPEVPVSADDVRDALAEGSLLCRNPASRFSFIRQEAGSVLLFVDGECFECSQENAPFAQQLCANDSLMVASELMQSEMVMECIATLVNQGSVALGDEDL